MNTFRLLLCCSAIFCASLSAQVQQTITVSQARLNSVNQPPDYFTTCNAQFYVTLTPASGNAAAYWIVTAFSMSGNFVYTANNTGVTNQALTVKNIEVLSPSGTRQGSGVYIGNGLAIPPGTYQLLCRWETSGAYANYSVTLNLPAGDTVSRKTTVTLSNPSAIPVTFKLYDGGPSVSPTPFQIVTVAAGQSTTVTVETASGRDIVIYGEAVNSALDADGNLVAGNGFTTWNAGTIANATMVRQTTGLESPNQGYVNNNSATPANIRSGTTNPVASSGGGAVFTQTGDVSALDKATFQVGTNALKSALDVINGSINASRGSGSDMTATNGKLDTLVTKATDANTSLTTIADVLTQRSAGAFSVVGKLGESSSAQAGAMTYGGVRLAGAVGAVTGLNTTAPTFAEFTVTPGHVMSLSFSAINTKWADADSLMRACRNLIALAVVIAFARSIGLLLTTYLVGIGNTPQADASTGVENLVPGVAQGKTWGSAGAVVACIMTFGAAAVAVVDGYMAAQGYGIASLFNAVNVGAVGAAVSTLDAYLPLATILQLGIARACAPFVIGPLYLACTSVIKFAKV